ncbi:hypothetical protein DDT91_19825 [Algoriphagus sp. AK58]|nr:hypothetical protein [Algoriphagus sp. AK58]
MLIKAVSGDTHSGEVWTITEAKPLIFLKFLWDKVGLVGTNYHGKWGWQGVWRFGSLEVVGLSSCRVGDRWGPASGEVGQLGELP